MSELSYGPFISREQAKEQGLKYWYNGKPCKRGHISRRRVNPNACVECQREQKKKPPSEPQKCEMCGKSFVPHIRTRKVRFCSETCNHEFNNKKLLDKRKAKRDAEEELNKWIPGYMPRQKAKEQGLKFYFVATRCKNGHIAPHLVSGGCSICSLEYQREWNKQWRKDNPKLAKQLDQQRVRPRTEQVRDREAAYREKNRERTRAYGQKYRKERGATDPQYKLRNDLSSLVGMAIKKQWGEKAEKTMELVGCSVVELMEHLESQFDEAMSWEDRGRDGWHVDHIRPCMSFDLTDPEQQKAAFNWRNLHPLWGSENISKSDNYEPADEVEWAGRMRALGYGGELFLLFEEGRGGLYGTPMD